MIFKKHSSIKNLFCLLFLYSSLHSQTQSFDIEWNSGSEDNLDQYYIYKGTAPGASNLIGTVPADSIHFTDTDIETGMLYYYRIRVRNTDNLFSGFSAEVSGAVPQILGFSNQVEISPNITTSFQLDNFVNDPDDNVSTLTWSINGQSILNVSIADRVANITPPADWLGQETLSFRAEDPQGCYDVVNVLFVVQENSPAITNFPNISFDEDGEASIPLNDYVQDPDNPVQNLVWSAENHNTLSVTIDPNTHIATFNAVENWYGNTDLWIYVTDPEQNMDSVLVAVQVNSLNDEPLFQELPDLDMSVNLTAQVDLKDYASDVEDSSDLLAWSHTTSANVSCSITVNGIATFSVSENWYGQDELTIYVSDLQNEQDSTIINVFRNEVLNPPIISTLNSVDFNEDSEAYILLSDYVSDTDDPVQNLFWYPEDHDIFSVNVDPISKIATFSALENWFGSGDIWIYVIDPAQNVDSALISIEVSSVNDAPILQQLPTVGMSIETISEINLNNYVFDVEDDDDLLRWSNSIPINISWSISENGIAQFSVEEEWYGQEELSIYVSDSQNAVDSSFIIIFRQDTLSAPSISGLNNLVIDEDSSYTVIMDQHIYDPDNSNEELQVRLINNSYVQLTVDPYLNTLSFIPDANWFGLETITLEVTDPNGNIDYSEISVTVNNVNDAPVFNQIGNRTIIGNTLLTIDLSEFIADADGIDDITEIDVFSSGNNYIGYYMDRNSNLVTFFAPSGIEAAETFMIRICDNDGVEASNVFLIELIEENLDGIIRVNFFGSETNINMTWTTVKATRDYIEYGLDASYGYSSDQEEVFSNQHDHTLQNLLGSTEYHFRVVSESENGITFSADSVFLTGDSPGAEVNVFPMPYVKSKDIEDRGIFFTNLPDNSKINIYNLLGEPVFKAENITSNYRWTVENNSSKKLSSGLYLYVINNHKNKIVSSGKIIVVR